MIAETVEVGVEASLTMTIDMVTIDVTIKVFLVLWLKYHTNYCSDKQDDQFAISE